MEWTFPTHEMYIPFTRASCILFAAVSGKSMWLYCLKGLYEWKLNTWNAFSKQGQISPLYIASSCAGVKGLLEMIQNAQPFQSWSTNRRDMKFLELRTNRECRVKKGVVVCNRRLGDRCLEGYVKLTNREIEFYMHQRIKRSAVSSLSSAMPVAWVGRWLKKRE